jgi:fermentation-respiration switch protein FrsA (DUF1100 family)
MASGIYNRQKANLLRGDVDLVNDTINVALYDNSHAFTATDTDYTTTNELPTAGGYTLGGAALASQSVTEAATSFWDADDISWTSATFTTYHAVIYDTTVTNDLIASIDFGGAQTVTAGTFTIQWNANGIISLV